MIQKYETRIVPGTITLPFGNDMLPKSRGKDMLPSKSQPDYGWLFAFLPYKNLDYELSLSPNGLLGRFSVPELPLPGLVMPGSNAPVNCRSGGNHAEGPLTHSANSHTRPISVRQLFTKWPVSETEAPRVECSKAAVADLTLPAINGPSPVP